MPNSTTTGYERLSQIRQSGGATLETWGGMPSLVDRVIETMSSVIDPGGEKAILERHIFHIFWQRIVNILTHDSKNQQNPVHKQFINVIRRSRGYLKYLKIGETDGGVGISEIERYYIKFEQELAKVLNILLVKNGLDNPLDKELGATVSDYYVRQLVETARKLPHVKEKPDRYEGDFIRLPDPLDHSS